MADSNRDITFFKNKTKYVLTVESRKSILKGKDSAKFLNEHIDELKEGDLIKDDEENLWDISKDFLNERFSEISRQKNTLQVFFQTTEAQNAIDKYYENDFETLKTELKKLLTTYIDKEKKIIESEESTTGGKKLRKLSKRSNTNKRKRSNPKRSTNKRKTNKRSKSKRSINKKRSTRRK
jgi:flavin-dependent dehydrogenase